MMINGVHFENISCRMCKHRHPEFLNCKEAAYWANIARAEQIQQPSFPSYETACATLVEYLKMKTEEGDWHGVSDAANDLRVLEAKHESTF